MYCVDALAILIILLPLNLYLLLLSSALVEIIWETLECRRICFKKYVYFVTNPNLPFFFTLNPQFIFYFSS